MGERQNNLVSEIANNVVDGIIAVQDRQYSNADNGEETTEREMRERSAKTLRGIMREKQWEIADTRLPDKLRKDLTETIQICRENLKATPDPRIVLLIYPNPERLQQIADYAITEYARRINTNRQQTYTPISDIIEVNGDSIDAVMQRIMQTDLTKGLVIVLDHAGKMQIAVTDKFGQEVYLRRWIIKPKEYKPRPSQQAAG